MNMLYEVSERAPKAHAARCCLPPSDDYHTISWSYSPPSSTSRRDSAVDAHTPVALITSQCLYSKPQRKICTLKQRNGAGRWLFLPALPRGSARSPEQNCSSKHQLVPRASAEQGITGENSPRINQPNSSPRPRVPQVMCIYAC